MSPKDRWSRNVADYDLPHLRLRTVAHVINEFKPKTVVDMGCAKGMLRKLIPSVSYTGCDFIEPQGKQDFRFYRCDFNREKIPGEIRGSDMVVASGLLEYIENLPSLLSQVRDILPEKGIFIATYLNMNHFSRRLRKILGMQVYAHPDWRGMYSLIELKKIFGENGFRIINIVPCSHSFFASKAVGETLNDEVILRKYHFYSALFAHQFIFACEKGGACS